MEETKTAFDVGNRGLEPSDMNASELLIELHRRAAFAMRGYFQQRLATPGIRKQVRLEARLLSYQFDVGIPASTLSAAVANARICISLYRGLPKTTETPLSRLTPRD